MEEEIVSAMVFDHSGTDVIVYCDSPIIDVTVSFISSVTTSLENSFWPSSILFWTILRVVLNLKLQNGFFINI